MLSKFVDILRATAHMRKHISNCPRGKYFPRFKVNEPFTANIKSCMYVLCTHEQRQKIYHENTHVVVRFRVNLLEENFYPFWRSLKIYGMRIVRKGKILLIINPNKLPFELFACLPFGTFPSSVGIETLMLHTHMDVYVEI